MAGGIPPGGSYDTTGWDGPVVGAGLSALIGRTESNVRAAKMAEIQGNSQLNALAALLWDGLPLLKLPLAILTAIAEALGLSGPWETVQQVLATLQSWGTAIWDAIEDAFEWLGLLIDGFLEMLGLEPVGNLLDRMFDLIDEVENILDSFGNLLWSLWNDPASVIASIPQTLVDGLTGFVSMVNDALNNFTGWIESIINTLSGGLGLPAPQDLFDGLLAIGTELGNLLSLADDTWAALGDLMYDLLNAPAQVLGMLPQAILDITSIAASIVTGVLSVANIPALDASKITTGKFTPERIEGLVDSLGGLGNSISGFIDAALVALGIEPEGDLADRIIDLADELGWLQETADTAANDAAQAKDDASQALGNWTTWLSEGSWPSIVDAVSDFLNTKQTASDAADDASQALSDADDAKNTATATSGNLSNLIGSLLSNPSSVIGVLGSGNIPALDASKITTGTLGTAQIPNLNASKITAGTLNADRIPTLPQSKVTDLVGDLSDLESDVSSALGNWATLLSEGSWANIAAAVSDILNAKDDAAQALSDASDAADAASSANSSVNNLLSGLLNDPSSLIGVLGTGNIPNLPASKVTSGTFNTARIPNLDASKITTGSFPQERLTITEIAANIISGVLGANNIPALDASKVTSGSFSTDRIPNLNASKITAGTLNADRIPTLAQSKITNLTSDLAARVLNNVFNASVKSGTNLVIDASFEDSSISRNFARAEYSTDFARTGTQSIKLWRQSDMSAAAYLYGVSTTNVNAGSFLVTPGETYYMEAWVYSPSTNTRNAGQFRLRARTATADGATTTWLVVHTANWADIPVNTWTKLSGYFTIPADRVLLAPYVIMETNIPEGDVAYVDDVVVREVTEPQGVVSALYGSIGSPLATILSTVVPNLDASKITSGTFGTGQIPNLAASKITSGTFNTARIPDLDASKITTGSFPQERLTITEIAANIISGVLGTNNIPALDASKITSGSFNAARIPTLPQSKITDLESDLSGLESNVSTALGNWSTLLSEGSWANIASAVSDILNAKSNAAQALSDASDAADAASSANNSISNLAAGLLSNPSSLIGVLGAGNIPNLAASKITSGTFNTARIPNLDASKITTGSFPQERLTITEIAANIISGVLGTNNIPALDASKVTTGSFSTDRIPSLDASKVTTGSFNTARIPNLDASKITTGNFAQSRITNLVSDLTAINTTATTAKSDLENTQEGIITNVLPGAGDGSSGVGQAMNALVKTVAGLTRDMQALQQEQLADQFSGKVYTINYADYGDGELVSVGVPFDLTYSGTGTGYQAVINGASYWVKNANGDREVIGRYTGGATETDFQWIQATAVAPMDVGAENAFCARMNSAKNTYVYVKGYRPGLFSFKAELGCVVNGVKTVFVTDVDVGFSLSLSLKAGVGDPYRFQVWSGDSLIIDYTDAAHVSQVGSNYRHWGFTAKTANNGNNIPGAASRFQCSDNAPAAVVGSGGRFFRSLTTGIGLGGGAYQKFPNNALDSVEYQSSDLTFTPGSNCRVTVSKRGLYVVTVVANFAANRDCVATLYKNGSLIRHGGSHPVSNRCGFTWSVNLDEGDYIEPGVWVGSNVNLVGSTSGDSTFFEIAKTR